MFWTIAIVLFVLWLLGLAGNAAGGVLQLLLVAAIIIALAKLAGGSRLNA